jgi:thioredoxin-dependent peroxiredoxin
MVGISEETVKSWKFFLFVLAVLLLSACGGQAQSGLKVGDTAPNFTLQSADGQTVSLSGYVGKQPVLLYFHMANG